MAIKPLLFAAGMVVSAGSALAATTVEILSTFGCGCCIGWEKHLQENGYSTDLKNLPMADLWQRKLQADLRDGLTSCHSGLVGGYVIDGQVPARSNPAAQ